MKVRWRSKYMLYVSMFYHLAIRTIPTKISHTPIIFNIHICSPRKYPHISTITYDKAIKG